MKKSFKLISAVLMAALFTAVSASAQWGPDLKATALSGGTNNVAKSIDTATSGTNTYSIDMAVPNSSYLAMSVSFNAASPNDSTTSNLVVVCKESIGDGLYNTATRRYAFAASGSNTMYFVTNIQLNASSILRITSIENYCTNAVTNIVISYTGKNGI